MLRAAKHLIDLELHAIDGNIGKVVDVLFDGRWWRVRYLVVDTGNWLMGRKVLIPFNNLNPANWQESHIPVDLTQKQVRESPPVDTDQPVSREMEARLHQFFHWSPYWTSNELYPAPGTVLPLKRDVDERREEVSEAAEEDNNLRSLKEVTGYTVSGSGGAIGELTDLVIDDEAWVIPFIQVNPLMTSSEDHVLITTNWVKDIDWENRNLLVTKSLQDMGEIPRIPKDTKIDHELEQELLSLLNTLV